MPFFKKSRSPPVKTVLHPREIVSQLVVDGLVVVGEFLASQYAFGTLAKVNIACKEVHKETLPALYRTMILKYDVSLSSLVKRRHAGFDLVKYLIIECAPSSFDLDAFTLNNSPLPTISSLKTRVHDIAEQVIPGKLDRPYRAEFGPNHYTAPMNLAVQQEPTQGIAKHIPALFPDLVAGIVKRREPALLVVGDPVLPCDVFLYREMSFRQLCKVMASTGESQHHPAQPQGVREVVLHKTGALVTTQEERQHEAAAYSGCAIAGAMSVRLTASPYDQEAGNWDDHLKQTLESIRAARGGLPIIRTTVRCSYEHLAKVMKISPHSLPVQIITADLLDWRIRAKDFEEAWDQGCDFFGASLRARVSRNSMHPNTLPPQAGSSSEHYLIAEQQTRAFEILSIAECHPFEVRIHKRSFPHRDHFQHKVVKRFTAGKLYVHLKLRHMSDTADRMHLDWRATYYTTTGSQENIKISALPSWEEENRTPPESSPPSPLQTTGTVTKS